jgi:hypothetical protein
VVKRPAADVNLAPEHVWNRRHLRRGGCAEEEWRWERGCWRPCTGRPGAGERGARRRRHRAGALQSSKVSQLQNAVPPLFLCVCPWARTLTLQLRPSRPSLPLQVDGKAAGASLDEVANKLKGASGSTVALSLGRRGLFGKETLTVNLKRASIQQPAAQPARAAATAKAAAAPARPQTSSGPRPQSPPRPPTGLVAPSTNPFLPGLFGTPEKKPEQRKPAGGPAEKKTGQSPPAQKPAKQKPEQGGSDPFGGMISFFGNVQSEIRAMSGQSSGSVGLACAASQGGDIVITGLQPGGAAEKSGKVNVYDILSEVDGKPCPATVEKASDMLRGPAGSTVALKLKRRGMFGEAFHTTNVTLTRTEDLAKKEAAVREAKQKEEEAKKAKAAAEAKAKAEAAAKKVEHVLKW